MTPGPPVLTGRLAITGVVEVWVFQGCRATRVLDVPAVKLFSQAGDSGRGQANIPESPRFPGGLPMALRCA
jgi:hypothetical protein